MYGILDKRLSGGTSQIMLTIYQKSLRALANKPRFKHVNTVTSYLFFTVLQRARNTVEAIRQLSCIIYYT